jgi:aminopeptidase N
VTAQTDHSNLLTPLTWCRRAFPCWDEPARKATFTLTLTVPQGMEALSNMPESQNTILTSGKRRVTFMPTPRMSTYLLCWCVGEFDSIAAMTKSGVVCKVVFVVKAQCKFPEK